MEFETPSVTEETAIFEEFTLSDGADDFGTVTIAVTVTPNGDEGESKESDDLHDEAPEVTGGCSTGSASGLAAFLPALALLLRRRRSR